MELKAINITQKEFKRSLQAAKKGKALTYHWRGGYLTREMLQVLVDNMRRAGSEKNKTMLLQINWPQAVVRVQYQELQVEESIQMEDANISEQCEVE